MHGAIPPVSDAAMLCTGGAPFVVHLGGIRAQKYSRKF
jgi:hypothetical protein